MAILRLNDGKHFTIQTNNQKRDRVYGMINPEGELIINYEESKLIKKIFEPLYSCHIQYIGKVIEALKV